MAGGSPKLGERAYARSPNFGYSFDFREVLRMVLGVEERIRRKREHQNYKKIDVCVVEFFYI